MFRNNIDSPVVRKPTTSFSDTDEEDFSSSTARISRGSNLERYPLLGGHGGPTQEEPYSDSEIMNVRQQVRGRSYQQQQQQQR